jgi:ADP-heptose:LPS heptosyltransferase
MKYPEAEIHALVNEQFLKVKAVNSVVDSWIGFPRSQLQDHLVQQPSEHKLAYQAYHRLLEELNHRNYQIVFNFTHNHLSARLLDQLNVADQRGLRFQNGTKVLPQNSWEDFLNTYMTESLPTPFTITEVMAKAFGISIQHSLNGSASRSETAPIYLQVLTSDSKKNWGLDNFRQLKNLLQKTQPKRDLKVMCSEDELPRVEKYFDRSEIETPNLAKAQELLREAFCLVSGDTSIQHLAAQVSCPTVSLFMGSADSTKTAPFSRSSIIINANSECYPCRHSEACSQTSHVCASSITPEDVLKIFSKSLAAEENRAPKSYNEARRVLERAVWEQHLNPRELELDLILKAIRPEFLQMYCTEVSDFADNCETLLSLVISQRWQEARQFLLAIKKETPKEFQLVLSPWLRGDFQRRDLENIHQIRIKFLTEINKKIGSSNGRGRIHSIKEHSAEA